jgi:hypothetical protein
MKMNHLEVSQDKKTVPILAIKNNKITTEKCKTTKKKDSINISTRNNQNIK